MNRISTLTLALLGAGLLAAGSCANAADVQVAKAGPAKRAVTPAQKQVREEAPAAADVHENLTPGQLAAARRVMTGTADCEFNQHVRIERMQDDPGRFHVAFNSASYTMTPQETTTGAVRLEDRRNGIVWLQIPSKSMMMNQKAGQRMVDGCTLAEQRTASR